MKDILKPIIIQSPPPLNRTNVNLDRSKFDDLIYKQGYDVYLESAVKCPCKSKGADSNLSTCKNCGSTGWVFINKTKTKAVLHSMNRSTEYKEWSQEEKGNVSITTMEVDRLSFMDRLTIIDAEATQKQVLYPTLLENGKYSTYTIYPPVSIEHIYAFIDDDEKLRFLVEGQDYTIGTIPKDNCKGGISDNFIIFHEGYSSYPNFTVTISYRHQPTYHIVDIPRNTMVSRQANKEDVLMPVNGIGMMSHYILDAENYNGDKLFDNSYDPSNPPESQLDGANLNLNTDFNV